MEFEKIKINNYELGMIRFERKKIYSRFFGIAFFLGSSILAIFSFLSSSTDNLIVRSNFEASLTGNQFVQVVLIFLQSYKHNLIWWVIVIIFFTLLGFFLGRLIDAKKLKNIDVKRVGYNVK